MTSLPKASFTRKTGTVIIGITLFGSLALAACGSPAADKEDSKAQPTAAPSASASAAPQDITDFTSDAFDLSKQVTITAKTEGQTKMLMKHGVVTRHKATDGNVTIEFTPFEDQDSAWKYTTEIPVGDNPNVRLMRWKDKSYLVVDGIVYTSQTASGLQAAKNFTATNVIVLDAATGKAVNVFKDEPTEVGSGNPEKFTFNPRSIAVGDGDTVIPFLTGLTYRAGNGKAKLVDPVTGETVATESKDSGPMSLNNEAGFFPDAQDQYGKSTTKGVFGNFTFIANENAPVKDKLGASLPNSTFTLVNTVTNETISTMKCIAGDTSIKTIYSENFRYVVFEGQYVFDTQTGKSFCTQPTGKEDVRRFYVSAVDNDGNMYGKADRDYLRVSLADNAKVETLLHDVDTQNLYKFPMLITEKGSAVFASTKSKDSLVVVPAKSAPND